MERRALERRAQLLRQPQAVQAMRDGHPEALAQLGFPPDARHVVAHSRAKYAGVLERHCLALCDGVRSAASISYGDTGDAAPAEEWSDRIGSWRDDRVRQIGERIAAYAHTGALRAPLIDLASEFDHLVPPAMHFVPYGRLVAAAGKSNLYRSELMPGTQHVDRWSDDPDFPTLQPGYPRVLAAFDELVRWVEG